MYSAYYAHNVKDGRCNSSSRKDIKVNASSWRCLGNAKFTVKKHFDFPGRWFRRRRENEIDGLTK